MIVQIMYPSPINNHPVHTGREEKAKASYDHDQYKPLYDNYANDGVQEELVDAMDIVLDERINIQDIDEAAIRNYNTIGLAIGGAMDTNTFRKCIEENKMPKIK